MKREQREEGAPLPRWQRRDAEPVVVQLVTANVEDVVFHGPVPDKVEWFVFEPQKLCLTFAPDSPAEKMFVEKNLHVAPIHTIFGEPKPDGTVDADKQTLLAFDDELMDALRLPYTAMSTSLEAAKLARRRLADELGVAQAKAGTLYGLTVNANNAGFWARLKYLFTGDADKHLFGLPLLGGDGP